MLKPIYALVSEHHHISPTQVPSVDKEKTVQNLITKVTH